MIGSDVTVVELTVELLFAVRPDHHVIVMTPIDWLRSGQNTMSNCYYTTLRYCLIVIHSDPERPNLSIRK